MHKKFLIIILILSLIFALLSFSACGRRARIKKAIEEKRLEESREEQSEENTGQTQDGTEEEQTESDNFADQDSQQGSQEQDMGQEELESQQVQEGEDPQEEINEEMEEENEETQENQEEIEPAENPEEEIIETVTEIIPIEVFEGGTITRNEEVYGSNTISVGDSILNQPQKGYVSFNIEGLSSSKIHNASLILECAGTSGNPLEFMNQICISHVSWGPRGIELGDYGLEGPVLCCSETKNIVVSTDKLIQELQNSIDNGRKRFQIVIFPKGQLTDNDSENDHFFYYTSDNGGDIIIEVEYSIE